jgi:hypothetical protein
MSYDFMNDCRPKGSKCVGENAILNFIKSNYKCFNTGRIIIFFVIANIYNKKTKGPYLYLNGIVHSHRKTEKALFDN